MRWSWLLVLPLAALACSELKRAPELTSEPEPTTPAPAAEPSEPEPTTKKPKARSPIEESDASSADAGDAGNLSSEYDKSDRLCDALCDWQTKCDGAGAFANTACLTGCGLTWSKRSAHLGESYVQYVESCFPSLVCTKIADVCLSNWDALPRPLDVNPVAKCLDLRKRCGVPTVGVCNELLRYDEDTQRHALTCTGVICDDAELCLASARGEVKDLDLP